MAAKKTTDTATRAQLDEVMRKYDRESNTRIWVGKPEIAVKCVLAAFSFFAMYSTLFAIMLDEVRLTSLVGCVLVMGYLIYPSHKGMQHANYIPWYDVLIMVLGAGAYFYFCFNANSIILRMPTMRWYEVIIGIIGICALFELCRRSTGVPIMVVAGFFIAYALYYYGIKKGMGFNAVTTLVRQLFFYKNGILSTPINACSKYIVMFIIFGAFLERSGITDFFIQLANCAAGSAAGGPAKVAVISSALCGMVSGSSVGNTVTTGSVTIPMMKKTGYKPEFAGAVEAAASTGGQIMPPIMGAAAFLMVDYIGDISYSGIVGRAVIPALLYFTGIYICVHLEAKKTNLHGMDRSELPRLAPLLKEIYLLLPIALLIWLVCSGTRTMAAAAALSILCTVAVSFVHICIGFGKQGVKTVIAETGKDCFDALAAGAKGCISVAVACGIAGIVAGCLTMTGLANQVLNAIVAVAGNAKLVALFLTMICCIILGMGVPTTANYCIMASTCAPILISMGIPKIAAHFFVFYFGIVADITPPVALAAYAGAAIAKANPMKTAVNATKLAIAAFIIPYILAYNPAMVLVDTNALEVIGIVITSLVGMYGLGVALEGYLMGEVKLPFRLLAAAGGLMLIYPGIVTDLLGVLLVAAVTVLQYLQAKRQPGSENPAALKD